ncbi:MAG: IS1595 family transposase [Marinifilaceae bacterium]|jgi:transposase-like protein|nr:IS1595 family transposase [Marinifilaceae bacterium]
MDVNEFSKIISEIKKLSLKQLTKIKEEISNVETEENPLLNLKEPKICPHCNSKEIVSYGFRNEAQRYKCKSCGKTYNILTNSPLAKLRLKKKWLKYCECLKSGYSIRKTAEICGINKNTALKWRHRFLENNKVNKVQKLTGLVEADDCFFFKSEKGNKKLNRLPRKRGARNTSNENSIDKHTLFVNIDGIGSVYDILRDKLQDIDIKEIYSLMETNSAYCVKNFKNYRDILQRTEIKNNLVNPEKARYLKNKNKYTNEAWSYCLSIQKWMLRFNGVASKYLENYLAWFRTLNELGLNINANKLLERAIYK